MRALYQVACQRATRPRAKVRGWRAERRRRRLHKCHREPSIMKGKQIKGRHFSVLGRFGFTQSCDRSQRKGLREGHKTKTKNEKQKSKNP